MASILTNTELQDLAAFIRSNTDGKGQILINHRGGLIASVTYRRLAASYDALTQRDFDAVEEAIGYAVSLHGYCLNGFYDRGVVNVENTKDFTCSVNDASMRQIRLGR